MTLTGDEGRTGEGGDPQFYVLCTKAKLAKALGNESPARRLVATCGASCWTKLINAGSVL